MPPANRPQTGLMEQRVCMFLPFYIQLTNHSHLVVGRFTDLGIDEPPLHEQILEETHK